MPNPIISVQNISKAYRLGMREETPDNLLSAAGQLVTKPLRKLRALRGLDAHKEPNNTDIFWALRDLSFEIQRGDIVGILGRNGAGKSTLLKVLSRITKPTSGRAIIRGRVSSLLEVGTGFHPELTGRENIYMNGTILGMRKHEIDSRFDQIVDFSGVEQFLDTPTKRYSSGMQVRLAFAVAANLEPEILVVDEVLAVGDIQFQNKCLGRMQEISKGGRTVLFVSHNVGSLRALCKTGINLHNGRAVFSGPIDDAIKYYDSTSSSNTHYFNPDSKAPQNPSHPLLRSITVNGGSGEAVRTGEPVAFMFTFESATRDTSCGFTLYDCAGNPLTKFHSDQWSTHENFADKSFNTLTCVLPECTLVPGVYRMNAAIFEKNIRIQHLDGVLSVTVQDGQSGGRPITAESHGQFSRFVIRHKWTRDTSYNSEVLHTQKQRKEITE